MLWTPALTLWFAAAMSYPTDLFTDAPGAAGPEAAYLWGPPQLDDDRDDVLAPRVGRSGIGAARELLEPDADTYARLDRGKIGNFVRLGRAGGRLDASFLRLGRGPSDGFIRLGRDRAAQNYIRLGRDRSPAAGFDDEEEGDAGLTPPRQTRGGQAGTPRIRSRKADASDGDLVATSGGPRRDAGGFQRARRTGASNTFGRGKLTDSNFIRLGRGGARVARSADGKENDEEDERVGYGAYPPLAADLPAYILGPELSLLPQPSRLALAANTKREKNYIRFG